MISWQYLAGFFDGEGNVDLYRRVRLTIVQKNREILDDIVSFLSGEGIKATLHHRVSQYKNKGVEYGPRDLWGLRVGGSSAVRMCKFMLPYLNVKKQPVEDAIRFNIWLPTWSARQRAVNLNRYSWANQYGRGVRQKTS